MKSFIIAVTVLLCVLGFVIFNSFCLTGLYNDLIEKASALPKNAQSDGTLEQVAHLYKYLNEKSEYLYFVLPHQSVNELLTSFSDILAAAETKDANGYNLSLRKAELILNQMKENEGFLRVF